MTGDIVVAPQSEEVIRAVRGCVVQRISLTPRGAGIGSCGQAMPLEGGVVRVEAGHQLIELEAETLKQGWEMRS